MVALTALLAQVETQAISENHNILYLIFHANPVVQLTILLLLIFSVVCWAIIFSKHRQVKNSQTDTREFLAGFWTSPRLQEMSLKKQQKQGPAFRIFLTAKEELEKKPGKLPVPILQRNVRRTYEEELEQLEYGVPFLATTASAAPFIGLFGTVWGILTAFWKIGQAGSSSLAIVGPHIAEALIATAIGLAAAIPAAIFYNVFISKIRVFSKDLEDFAEDLVERFKNEYGL